MNNVNCNLHPKAYVQAQSNIEDNVLLLLISTLPF